MYDDVVAGDIDITTKKHPDDKVSKGHENQLLFLSNVNRIL